MPTRKELQEMRDMIDGKLKLDDEELLYWLKKDMQKLLTAYATLEAERDAAGAEALREAKEIADNVATLEAGMERRDGYMAASDIGHRIEMHRAAQPEPPTAGTQIIYVPAHAGGDLDHSDCEIGFVFRNARSPIHGFVYCRYWSKHSPGELRTKARSELTPLDLIVIKDTVPQQQVEDTMQELNEPEADDD